MVTQCAQTKAWLNLKYVEACDGPLSYLLYFSCWLVAPADKTIQKYIKFKSKPHSWRGICSKKQIRPSVPFHILLMFEYNKSVYVFEVNFNLSSLAYFLYASPSKRKNHDLIIVYF